MDFLELYISSSILHSQLDSHYQSVILYHGLVGISLLAIRRVCLDICGERINCFTPFFLFQIKFAALSAWSCHLIWAQKKVRLDGQVNSFCLDEVPNQLLDYFQRSLMNVDTPNNQSHTSLEVIPNQSHEPLFI